MRIERASVEDAGEILVLQKVAYRSEADIYDNFSIPPLTQTLDEVHDQFRDHVFLKATEGDGSIVGSVRASERDGTCHIGKLIVSPGSQGQGIGTALMREIESAFAGVSRFELFTGDRSERNLGLYEHLGYRRFREAVVNDSMTMVFMQKSFSSK